MESKTVDGAVLVCVKFFSMIKSNVEFVYKSIVKKLSENTK